MKKHIIWILSILLLSVACTKEEGKGGLASISGVVMVQPINENLEKVGDPYPCSDEKIYISYGANQTVDDDVDASPNGTFIFDYLVPGSYTIFAYSDDTVNYKSPIPLTIKKQVELSNKKDKATLDTIVIYKHVDFNEGIASVTGSVKMIYHWPKSPTNVDTSAYVSADIFIQYLNSPIELTRIRTDKDGKFQFSNLNPGTYVVWGLSEHQFMKNYDEVVSDTIVVSKNTKLIELDSIVYLHKYNL